MHTNKHSAVSKHSCNSFDFLFLENWIFCCFSIVRLVGRHFSTFSRFSSYLTITTDDFPSNETLIRYFFGDENAKLGDFVLIFCSLLTAFYRWCWRHNRIQFNFQFSFRFSWSNQRQKKKSSAMNLCFSWEFHLFFRSMQLSSKHIQKCEHKNKNNSRKYTYKRTRRRNERWNECIRCEYCGRCTI